MWRLIFFRKKLEQNLTTYLKFLEKSYHIAQHPL